MDVACGGDFTELRCCHSVAVSGRYVLKSKLADIPAGPREEDCHE
jgi:hypothetical protein